VIELTEQQQAALDSCPGEPLRLVDPRTQQHFVLLPTEVYERVRMIFGDEAGLDGIDVGALIADAMREDDENDPLLESYQKYRDRP
jgi:hypothetical protein